MAAPNASLIYHKKKKKNIENISKLHFDRSGFLTNNAHSYYAQQANTHNKRQKQSALFCHKMDVNSYTLIRTEYENVSGCTQIILFISSFIVIVFIIWDGFQSTP